MIHVTLRRKNQRIYVLKVTGHALSAPYGEDLVCAGVSAIATGGANALKPQGIRIHLSEGLADFQVDNLEEMSHQHVLEILWIQLKTIQASYSQFISIKEQED